MNISDCGCSILARLVAIAVFVTASSIAATRFDTSIAIADSLNDQLERRGSLSLRDTPLREAIFTVGESWGVNIVVGKDAEGSVNGSFRDTPLREVLDSILLVNGYTYQRRGNTLVVMKRDEARGANPSFRSEVIPLQQQVSEEILAATKLLASPDGTIQAIPSTNSLLAIDTPDAIGRIRNFLGNSLAGITGATTGPTLARTPQTAFTRSHSHVEKFKLEYVDAVQMEVILRDTIAAEGSVSVLPAENRLLVIGSDHAIELAKSIIEKLDVPRPQVRISAFIYDLNLSEIENLGVNWSHQVKGAGVNGAGVPNSLLEVNGGLLPALSAAQAALGVDAVGGLAGAATAVTQPNQLAVQTLQKHFDLRAVVRALDETRGARLLADPSVTVVDREEASIRIVTRVPVQQLTQTEAGGNIGTTTFEEAGITLTVVPSISRDGTILMRVTPTFSVLAGFQNSQPIIDTREATTVVRVANEQPFVIGGLRQRAEVETVRGVPRLMNWRGVGKLFRDHETEIRESELVVFLLPQLVDPVTLGRPREERAHCVTEKTLNRIPYAEDVPFIPPCGDKACPYHNPRPRINGGSDELGPSLSSGRYRTINEEITEELPVGRNDDNHVRGHGALNDTTGGTPAVPPLPTMDFE